MKREVILLAVFVVFGFFGSSMASAAECILNTTLINQEPYPAIPGDYVKVVFQVTGVENPECKGIVFELIENYPISFDPGAQKSAKIISGTYSNKDFTPDWIIPFKVRLDTNVEDGENKIEVALGFENSTLAKTLKTFYIDVDNSRADFEIHVDRYSYSTKELTLEVLNIGKNDVEALTLEIPKQPNIQISGSNRAIVGDLDSSEFTTADFKADVSSGDFQVKVLYTDQNSIRREMNKKVTFDSSYFQPAGGEDKQISWIYYALAVIIILLIIVLWIIKSRSNRRERALRRGSARL